MSRRKKGVSAPRKRAGQGSRSATGLRLLICAAGCLVTLALFVVAIVPARYDLTVGMVPTSTITATKDVVDELSTQQRREDAANAVPPTYRYQDGVTEQVMAAYDQIFSQLRLVRQYGETLPDQSATRLYSADELQYARDMLTLISLRDYQLTSLLHSTQEELEEVYSLIYAALQSTMLGHVTEGQEAAAVSNIRQIVDFRLSLLGQNLVSPVLSACIKPNMLIDQEATAAAREAAQEAVEPVVYRQGQNIVVKGEGRVTANQLALLSTLGLLSGEGTDLPTYLGAAMLVIATIALMLALLRRQENSVMEDTARLLLMFTVFLLCLGLCMLGRLVNAYAVPMLLCALLMTALLGARTGVICSAALTVLIGALSAGGSGEFAETMAVLVVSGLLSGTAAALLAGMRVSRLWLLFSGLLGSLIDALSILAIGLMTASQLSGSLVDAAWKVGSSLQAALLCIGIQPLLEIVFNLPTPTKLMELSNPNQPLLRRLLLEAPGTYHHSTIVSNLAEAAAEAVGANPLLARVGGLYHDIGKLKRPSYFAENQLGGVNAHDHTDPQVSAAILTAHTKDGVALAKAYRLPREVQTIIAEHHGNTPVMFFYHKALQQADGKPVDIDAFRYDGRPPRTREGAIILLCDTIEAAVRTMKNPTAEGIEEFIVRLVRGKLEDGQLSDCPLTLRDIDKICAAAAQVLLGVFHERIEYPTMEEEPMHIVHPVEEAEATAAAPAAPDLTVPDPAPAALNVVEMEAQQPLPVVTPETPEDLVAVEVPPSIQPVEIDQLIPVEPLPTKEQEAELLKKAAEAGEEQP